MVLQLGPVPGALGRYAPTLHLDAHTRSLRDCGLTGKRDATRPFLPRSVHLVMLHQGCGSFRLQNLSAYHGASTELHRK